MSPRHNAEAEDRIRGEAERELNEAMHAAGGEINRRGTETGTGGTHTRTGRPAAGGPGTDVQREMAEATEAARREWEAQQGATAHTAQGAEVQQAECPSCGNVYENMRACPVDGTPLRVIGPWEPGDRPDTEEVLQRAAHHYPTQER